MKKGIKELERLISIVKELREKCPWDKKQTTESLRTLTIEEVYELSEAITTVSYTHLTLPKSSRVEI